MDSLTNLESVTWIRAEALQLLPPPPRQRGSGEGAGAGPGGGDAADLSSAALGPALQGRKRLPEGGSAYRLNRKLGGLGQHLKAWDGTRRLFSV